MSYFTRFRKSNPYHDEGGHFTSKENAHTAESVKEGMTTYSKAPSVTGVVHAGEVIGSITQHGSGDYKVAHFPSSSISAHTGPAAAEKALAGEHAKYLNNKIGVSQAAAGPSASSSAPVPTMHTPESVKQDTKSKNAVDGVNTFAYKGEPIGTVTKKGSGAYEVFHAPTGMHATLSSWAGAYNRMLALHAVHLNTKEGKSSVEVNNKPSDGSIPVVIETPKPAKFHTIESVVAGMKFAQSDPNSLVGEYRGKTVGGVVKISDAKFRYTHSPSGQWGEHSTLEQAVGSLASTHAGYLNAHGDSPPTSHLRQSQQSSWGQRTRLARPCLRGSTKTWGKVNTQLTARP